MPTFHRRLFRIVNRKHKQSNSKYRRVVLTSDLINSMITLSKKIREEKEKKSPQRSSNVLSVRDVLLTKEVPEMMENLPDTCTVCFKDPDVLSVFDLSVTPDEGFWLGGKFCFHINIPEEYNIKPPMASCKTKIWHPNINEEGQICLSLLREHTIDGSGWAPTRKLKDLIWGINSLFTDLLDFDDALNTKAAEQHKNEKEEFEKKVLLYIDLYAR
ncbi:NEDD8-conjugating enzyme UBE2F-like [Xenia sp. Carnegie-2017]|uniref:NEDD8-conjugating enzyme UBE2F-like n=1 Tax=Xenia sp. Carnegie-2017 TaxID=2897299 RepID=UPI001F04FBC4|nr:NEDD8-conjugating enzyme UBE2F-like [Xenia sp. Carnegie-2017]